MIVYDSSCTPYLSQCDRIQPFTIVQVHDRDIVTCNAIEYDCIRLFIEFLTLDLEIECYVHSRERNSNSFRLLLFNYLIDTANI